MDDETPAAPVAERTEWDTTALREDFEVIAFAAPFVQVRRRADGQIGTLRFDHAPRRYYDWVADA
ncbi:hypothetical protein QDA04_gp66 [Microbacterium phage Megan]|uniref:Uncharacterized protein n=1 Tax=Microbacterium phage Megan TaxID=2656551 RepID=A0A649VK34_9CAUD|nr:hypothetical protein QDA04_gp66 [Microbacterium phage Megan]QGJ92736.1 hypothetical protein PBI_MEGAN_66 [Microbacterium phage Megan]